VVERANLNDQLFFFKKRCCLQSAFFGFLSGPSILVSYAVLTARPSVQRAAPAEPPDGDKLGWYSGHAAMARLFTIGLLAASIDTFAHASKLAPQKCSQGIIL
jgi:hypothetical protein